MRTLGTCVLAIALVGSGGCAQILGIDQEYELEAEDAAAEDELDADLERDAELEDGGPPGEDGRSPAEDAAQVEDASQPSGFDCASLGGKLLDDHCYFVVGQGTGLTWSRAKTTCEGFSDAQLVSVTSAAEQTAIEGAFFPSTSDYWIGLALAGASTQTPPSSCKTIPGSCPFLWASGERLSYTHWAMRSGSDQEPNFTGACVRLQLTDKSWADYGCGAQLPAICEHD